MKKNLHPETHVMQVPCACGNTQEVLSTSDKVSIDICSACHPYFTGQQKFIDTAGRIEKFNDRYKRKQA